ncbi:DUF3997 domain-containing protein [Peribacillus simplex]|uniref:DUF3997 domain-containing protein n=1 Tax=Peribacillus simplex TaxID=1478 RepID=UPI001626B39B|nr:DUF3997 domain-containing protein [Peribacillus simplex]
MRLKNGFKFIFIFLCFYCLLAGCSGLSDYEVDLPGSYSIVSTSEHQVTISPKIGEGSWDSAVVPAKVVEVGWDKNFILAKQVDLVDDPENPNNYEIPDKDTSHYWIIDIGTGVITGPLDEQNFADKKSELSISKDIKLKNVDDIR